MNERLQTTMAAKITSGIFQTGSFGIHKAGNCRGDEQIKIWFCGKGRASHILADICAHRTRREAEECAKKGGKQ